MTGERSRGHGRRWLSVVTVSLAALALAVDAHAEDLVPAPAPEAEAALAEVEAILEEAVASAAEAGVAEIAPGGTAQPMVDEPEPASAEAAAPVEAPLEPVEPIPAPDLPEAPPAPAPASEPADTSRYHPSPDGSPAPEGGGSAPADWTWIWTWNCTEPVEPPAPSGDSWTWIWTWNCDEDAPTSDAISVGIDEQYQERLERYQEENRLTFSPINMNTSIRLFSPGDDGAVTQVNSIVATAASVIVAQVESRIEETMRQSPVELPPPPQVAPGLSPLGGADVLGAAPLPAMLDAWLGAGGSIAAEMDTLPSVRPSLRAPGPLEADTASRAVRGESPAGMAAASIAAAVEPAAPSRREPRKRARDDAKPAAPALPVLPSTVAGGGAAAGAGSGAVLLVFLVAFALAHLAVAPGITYRLGLAEARIPRGVDLGEDDPPG